MVWEIVPTSSIESNSTQIVIFRILRLKSTSTGWSVSMENMISTMPISTIS